MAKYDWGTSSCQYFQDYEGWVVGTRKFHVTSGPNEGTEHWQYKIVHDWPMTTYHGYMLWRSTREGKRKKFTSKDEALEYAKSLVDKRNENDGTD